MEIYNLYWNLPGNHLFCSVAPLFVSVFLLRPACIDWIKYMLVSPFWACSLFQPKQFALKPTVKVRRTERGDVLDLRDVKETHRSQRSESSFTGVNWLLETANTSRMKATLQETNISHQTGKETSSTETCSSRHL